jgi:hypothetical protein
MNVSKIINLIIDELEGGYYHPDMKSKLKGGEKMLDSGETMFGIDRKNGGSDVTQSDAGKQFWQIVDANYSDKHSNIAYYNDKADGKKISKRVGDQLRYYVKELMLTRFEKYSKYLSDKVKQIVVKSPALLLQFLYSCWNGAGNFQNFATAVNNAYESGIKSADELFEVVNAARRAKGGLFVKQADIMQNLKNKVNSNFRWWWLFAASLGLYLILKK